MNESNEMIEKNSRYAGLPISLSQIREFLSVALLCDALDTVGQPFQSPRIELFSLSGTSGMLIGRAKTTLWTDMAHVDPEPYKLELAAIDTTQSDDVMVCAASGSMRSGIWGELLSSAARNVGCAGVIVHGAVRDVEKIRTMNFPLYASGKSPYDSRNRQRVVDYDVKIEIGGVQIAPGDLIAADEDGVVVIPQAVENQVIQLAWDKIHAENRVRDAIVGGMSATEAFHTFGVL
jgi:4-hydroxy-4-methyl-2-oxoglutarate aldolase